MNSDTVLLPYRPELSAAENLRRVLRFAVSDGILSIEEVWCLADWINKHPATADCWPGTELVPYLQLIWDDGQLTAQEIRGLSALIAVIEMEFAKQTPSSAESKTDESNEIKSVLSDALALLQLPSASQRTSVKSSSGDEDYEIDLSGPSCTCPDWVDRRRSHPQGHPGRACKHIIRTLFEAGLFEQVSKPLQGLLQSCLLRNGGTSPKEEYSILDLAGQKLILSYAGTEWVNVLVPIGKDYERFGYSLAQKRWAYGESPKGTRAIRAAIHSIWPEPEVE